MENNLVFIKEVYIKGCKISFKYSKKDKRYLFNKDISKKKADDIVGLFEEIKADTINIFNNAFLIGDVDKIDDLLKKNNFDKNEITIKYGINEITIKYGININAMTYIKCRETTVLIEAVGTNQVAVTRLLLERGADPSLGDRHGVTPLIAAAVDDYLPLLLMLIEAKAEVDSAEPVYGCTAFHYVCMEGNADCAEALVRAGCDTSLRTKDGKTGREIAQQMGHTAVLERLDALEKERERELVEAAYNNELQTMERLIAEGVSVEAKDEYGDPAVFNAAHAGHLDALKLLRQHGANLDATDSDGETALMTAARWGKADCAEALLEWGADKDAANNYGNTALHLAANWPRLECARLLVRARADRAKKNNDGETALDLARQEDPGWQRTNAATRSLVEIVALLEQADAEKNKKKRRRRRRKKGRKITRKKQKQLNFTINI